MAEQAKLTAIAGEHSQGTIVAPWRKKQIFLPSQGVMVVPWQNKQSVPLSQVSIDRAQMVEQAELTPITGEH
jgi:hypothetical protein